jgi:hypothetical protein
MLNYQASIIARAFTARSRFKIVADSRTLVVRLLFGRQSSSHSEGAG